MGMKISNISKRPKKLADIQALAALGQSRLMSIYEAECEKYNFHASQMLLTSEDLCSRERHLNVLNCINAVWSHGNLPVINENDSVSIDEIKFGDNDTLAAMAAVMTRSDLTILLTTVDGLHTTTPDGKLDKRIPVVKEITKEIYNLAAGTDNNAFSIGGMYTKLKAAEIVTSAGEQLLIADGRKEGIISDIFSGKNCGTLFPASSEKQMQSKKRWLQFFTKEAGIIKVDKGAEHAISRNGSSLLPSGITSASGAFKSGDAVLIVNAEDIPVAKGLTNFSASELLKILGKQTNQIEEILGTDSSVVIHRDNLAIL